MLWLFLNIKKLEIYEDQTSMIKSKTYNVSESGKFYEID